MSFIRKKGTFFGNLLRSLTTITGVISPGLTSLITSATGIKDISTISNLISKEKGISESQKKLMFKELEQDVLENQEITKRWASDMTSDSWLSKNVRPLSLSFLTVVFFIQSTMDSCFDWFHVESYWISLQENLLMLVYAGYFGARALEKISKIKSEQKNI